MEFVVVSKFWSFCCVDACVGAALNCPPTGFLICSISKGFVTLDRVGEVAYTDLYISCDNYPVDVFACPLMSLRI